ncbi:hypothetical protein GGI43DRAFT_424826 [Trichoderma evansii]
MAPSARNIVWMVFLREEYDEALKYLDSKQSQQKWFSAPNSGTITITPGKIGLHNVKVAYAEKMDMASAILCLHRHVRHVRLILFAGVDYTSNFGLSDESIGNCVINTPTAQEADFGNRGNGITAIDEQNASLLLLAVQGHVESHPMGLYLPGDEDKQRAVLHHAMFLSCSNNDLCCGPEVGPRVPCMTVRGFAGHVDGEPWVSLGRGVSATVIKGIIKQLGQLS